MTSYHCEYITDQRRVNSKLSSLAQDLHGLMAFGPDQDAHIVYIQSQWRPVTLFSISQSNQTTSHVLHILNHALKGGQSC